MDTDHIFHELFRNHPEWLRELTDLPLPEGCRGSSPTLKQLEIRCDLLLEPEDASDPCYLVEFQLYHDHSIFNRIELARQILWKHLNPREECRRRDYCPRQIEAVVIFGSRKELPSSHEHYPQMHLLFMDELLDSLRRKSPDSPLVATLAPLTETPPELENSAAEHYSLIKRSPILSREDREDLEEIFQLLLLQQFTTKSREEIRKMITELTPLHEIQAVKELLEEGIERGIERGIEKGVADLIRVMAAKGKTPAEISELTDLSAEEVDRFLASEQS